ncbi:hypothetical protein CASFOL_001281 [Castilleja foliolosa]|uniref:Uncharacterized protein n=1 Tax=Castilleja foliolosa TaxID=1961234 RepID=A0ABD3ER08_9LAMI
MFYGTVVWDPWVIVAQIVCLQCLYNISLGLFLSILVGPRVTKMSLVYFFDFATITASTSTGWCVMASIFLSSIAGKYRCVTLENFEKTVSVSEVLLKLQAEILKDGSIFFEA